MYIKTKIEMMCPYCDCLFSTVSVCMEIDIQERIGWYGLCLSSLHTISRYYRGPVTLKIGGEEVVLQRFGTVLICGGCGFKQEISDIRVTCPKCNDEFWVNSYRDKYGKI